MAIKDLDLASVKIKTQPTNYGVNQISVGVVGSNGNSTITTTSYSKLIVARGLSGYPETPVTTGISQAQQAVVLPGFGYGPKTSVLTVTNASSMRHGSWVYVKWNKPGTGSGSSYGQVFEVLSSTSVVVDFGSGFMLNTTFSSGQAELTAVPNGSIVKIWEEEPLFNVPSSTTVLGVTAPYHVFETGYYPNADMSGKYVTVLGSSSVASTTSSPGKGATGNPSYQGQEIYYSAYVYDINRSSYATGAVYSNVDNTITYTAYNNFTAGQTAIITGFTPDGFNFPSGVVISSATPTSFVVSTTVNPGAWLVGGYAVVNVGWKALPRTSQVSTKDYGWYRDITRNKSKYGKLIYDSKRSTTQWILDNLPPLYKTNAKGNFNTDLQNFLSLFAFYYDTYRTAADVVFSRSSVKQIDTTLLTLFLDELGIDLATLDNDPYLGRKILSNIIRAYKTKGSLEGIQLASELFTGYTAAIATTETNLIPDSNSASFIEGPNIPSFWSGAVATTTMTIRRVGSPWRNTSRTSQNDNGVMLASAHSTQPIFITSAPRYAVVRSQTASGSTNILVNANYGAVRPGDYIINFTATNPYVPTGAYVKRVIYGRDVNGFYPATSANVVTTVVSNVKTSGGVLATNTILLLSQAGPDKAAAVSKLPPVSALTTYAYSFYVNGWGATGLPDVRPVITWYKATGDPVSTNLSVTTATSSGGVTTYTTAFTSNRFLPGQYVSVTGMLPINYNISGLVSSSTSTQFQIVATVSVTATQGGTATGPWNSLGALALVVTGSTWRQVTMTAVAPTGSSFAAPGLISDASLNQNSNIQFDAFQFEQGSIVSSFVTPTTASVTLTAVNAVKPLDPTDVTKALYNLKDYRVSSFIPQATAVSTTYSVVAIKDTSRDELDNITNDQMAMPDYLNRSIYVMSPDFRWFTTATMVLSTSTSNIVVGQTFSLMMLQNPSTTFLDTVNNISHGMIIGVISPTEYRFVRRDTADYGISNTSGVSISNNLYMNNPNPLSITTTSV